MQNALIVDDSRTAAFSLKRMLERQQISSAMVESGEQALQYLRENDSPDIIFMDHMMPGMDGFEAVKAIKTDDATATIPIVMHTSQSGDMYVGQARALGAADILGKPASEERLLEVLERVGKQRRAREQSDQELPPSLTPVYLTAVDSDAAATRRATTATQPIVTTSAGHGPLRQLMAAVLLLAPIAWLLALYLPAEAERKQLLQQQEALYRALEWVANQSGDYDFGEAPMGGRRLQLLEGLVAQLAAADFKGTVRLEGHVGEFCLIEVPAENGGSVTLLPPADLSLDECDMIGLPGSEAMLESGRESAAFKRFVAGAPLLQASGIRVEVVQAGASQPAVDYPGDLENLTAGDWNAVALQNTRVRFVIEPDNSAERADWLVK